MKAACEVLAVFLALALRFQLCLAALYTDANDLPKTVYDFVIVGGMWLHFSMILQRADISHCSGGTAGSAVAARLTEEKSYSVLVIEAGLSLVHASGAYAGS